MLLRETLEIPHRISIFYELIAPKTFSLVYPKLDLILNKLQNYLKGNFLYKLQTCRFMEALAQKLYELKEKPSEPAYSLILEGLSLLKYGNPPISTVAKHSSAAWKALLPLKHNTEDLVKYKTSSSESPVNSDYLLSFGLKSQKRKIIRNHIAPSLPDIKQTFHRRFLNIQSFMDRKLSSINQKLSSLNSQLVSTQSKVSALLIENSHISMWNSALYACRQGDMETAYQLVITSKDDLFLVRLMYKTGPCLDKLSPALCSSILRRLSVIIKSQFIKELSKEWLNEASNIPLSLCYPSN